MAGAKAKAKAKGKGRAKSETPSATVKGVCRFYAEGRCKFGDQCNLDHVKPLAPVENANVTPKPKVKAKAKAEATKPTSGNE